VDRVLLVVEADELAARRLEREPADGAALDAGVDRSGRAEQTTEHYGATGILVREQDETVIVEIGKRDDALAASRRDGDDADPSAVDVAECRQAHLDAAEPIGIVDARHDADGERCPGVSRGRLRRRARDLREKPAFAV